MDRATAHYRAAIRRAPSFQPARYRLGNLLFKRGRLSQAKLQLERALELDGGHAESHLALARTLESMNDAAGAERHFEAAITLSPGLARAYLNYGNFVMRRGDRPRATQLLTRFQELKSADDLTARLLAVATEAPSDRASRLALVEHLTERGALSLALRSVHGFVLEDPDAADNYLLLAEVYHRMERDREARRTLGRGLERIPESRELQRALRATEDVPGGVGVENRGSDLRS